MKKALVITVLFALVAVAPAAFAAGSAGGTLTVNASVAANCTIGAATLDFGAYDPVSANGATGIDLDSSTTMTVACTKGVAPTIGIPAAGRTITAGVGNTLNYELYKDSGYSQVWGASGGGLLSPPAPGKGGAPITIYGRIPKDQDAGVAALYTGTITVTVNF